MKRFLRFFIALFALVGLTSGYFFLNRQSRWQARKLEATAAYKSCAARYKIYRSYEQYHTTLSIPYVSTVPQQEWARRYHSLQVGMSEREVEMIMGVPDYAYCGMNMEGTLVLSSWNYELEVQEDLVNYKKNRWVELFFDYAGKLKDKDAVNIQGIPNRQLPEPGRT